MSYLLDTDTFNHFHSGQPKVLQRAAAAGPALVAITVVTRIEVLHGRFEFVRKAANFAQLRRAQQRLDESDRYLSAWRIVPFDHSACDEFDRLRVQKALRKIGRADILIASIALANRATLITRNTRDFELIPGLQIENWVD